MGSLQGLPEAHFHILIVLADGEKHGYSIMQEVAALTGGKTRLSPGTLYGAIQRLVEQGYIEEVRGGVPRRVRIADGGGRGGTRFGAARSRRRDVARCRTDRGRVHDRAEGALVHVEARSAPRASRPAQDPCRHADGDPGFGYRHWL